MSYNRIVERVFLDRFRPGDIEVEFVREDLVDVATQFAQDDLIAMFEVALDQDEIKVVQEKHYRLVPASEVTRADLLRYRDST